VHADALVFRFEIMVIMSFKRMNTDEMKRRTAKLCIITYVLSWSVVCDTI
jgi:hypothetical protein